MKQKPVILCVDDQKEILDSLEDQVINRLGGQFECELAESGEEALELIEELLVEKGANVAVIISDHLMPGMKGDEFLIKAHELVPQTLKILLTGQASIQAVRNVINKARLYRYVEKPWQEADLMLTIEEAAKSYMQHLQLLEYNRMLRLLNNATQELSSEINVASLFEKFMASAMESSEAERGYVVVDLEGELNVQAVASVIKDEAQRLKLKQTNENAVLTNEVLQKVNETLSTKPEENYRIASPIHKGNKNIGYVYVENALTRAAFNSIQREILQMLASQAAISIENATLYESLKVRTTELQEEKEKLAKVNLLIEQKNQDVLDSIRYAKRIQESIMPELGILEQRFNDSFCLYMPKDIVSGDFYWWIENGERFMLAAVDCTGHGVPGAFMSVLASNFLNQIVNEYSITEPEVILEYLNIRVRLALKQEANSGSKDGMDLGLVTIAKNPSDNKFQLSFAGARRPLYILRKNATQIEEMEGDKLSIGEVNQDGSDPFFTGKNIELEKGDIFFVLTDGIADQFGGPQHRKYSTRRVREYLVENRDLPMKLLSQQLRTEIEQWKGDIEQTDDILIIGIRV